MVRPAARPEGRLSSGAVVGVLTRRELDVLSLAAAGRRDAEIAAALFVSCKTVEFHMGNVFDKLGVRSRTQAVAVAIARGVLTADSPGLSAPD